jgi:hypothetical protein
MQPEDIESSPLSDAARRRAGRDSPVRIYQLALLHTSGSYGFVFEVAPPSTVGQERGIIDRIDDAARFAPQRLTFVLFQFLAVEENDVLYKLIHNSQLFTAPDVEKVPKGAAAFAEYAAFTRIVPVEQSPIDTEALITLVQQGVAAVGNVARNPLIVIEGTFGVVAVTAIRRWGKAVTDVGEQAIRYYLPRLLRLPRNPSDK